MSCPSLIALPLEAATRALDEAGIRLVEVVRTAPPRGGPGGPARACPPKLDQMRVVRERYSAEGAQLTVAEAMPGPERQSSVG